MTPSTTATASPSAQQHSNGQMPTRFNNRKRLILVRCAQVVKAIFALVAVAFIVLLVIFDQRVAQGLIETIRAHNWGVEGLLAHVRPATLAWGLTLASPSPFIPNFARALDQLIRYEVSVASRPSCSSTPNNSYNWHALTPQAILSCVTTLYFKGAGSLLLILFVISVIAGYLPPTMHFHV